MVNDVFRRVPYTYEVIEIYLRPCGFLVLLSGSQLVFFSVQRPTQSHSGRHCGFRPFLSKVRPVTSVYVDRKLLKILPALRRTTGNRCSRSITGSSAATGIYSVRSNDGRRATTAAAACCFAAWASAGKETLSSFVRGPSVHDESGGISSIV